MARKLKPVILIIAITLSLGLVPELLLRLFGYHPDGDTFRIQVCGELVGQFDPDLFWRLQGVRPQFDCRQDRKCLKIMCLTDSVAVMYRGRGYPDILQRLLSERIPDENPQVFNGGVPGYTTFQGLKYFRTELLEHRPDIVTVCYGWNDHWQAGNGLPDKNQKPRRSDGVSLRTISLIRHLVFRFQQEKYHGVGPAETMRVGITDYEHNLRAIVRLCRRYQVTPILMTAPSLGVEEDWVPAHRAYNEVVRDIARQENLPLVDLVPDFRGRDDLFIDPPADKCHYNWEGSEIVARALAEAIVTRLPFDPAQGLRPREAPDATAVASAPTELPPPRLDRRSQPG